MVLASLSALSEFLHIVEVDHSLTAPIAEAGVISAPTDVTNLTNMALALQILWVFERLEVVDVGINILANRKQMTAITELHLLA